MSTTSSIAVVHTDGTVSQAYCHFDGYLTGVGQTLFKYYTDLPTIEQLIRGGDMSSLGNTPDSTDYYTNRGEPLVLCKFASFEEYKEFSPVQEFNYIYCNGEWLFATHSSTKFVAVSAGLTSMREQASYK